MLSYKNTKYTFGENKNIDGGVQINSKTQTDCLTLTKTGLDWYIELFQNRRKRTIGFVSSELGIVESDRSSSRSSSPSSTHNFFCISLK